MDIFPKFIASMFVIIMAVYLGISMVICGISVVSARTFYTSVSDFVESASAEDEAIVIEECKMLAENNGYTLTTEKKTTSDSRYYYDFSLDYTFVMPIFNKPITGTVHGSVYPQMHYNAVP